MRLTVNGEAREVPGGVTIAALVTLLGLDRRKLAVERNLEIVPRSAFVATPLAEGDRIDHRSSRTTPGASPAARSRRG
jgi:thiamine biosynthesis protein ThiS